MDKSGLMHSLNSINPYLNDIVIIGGWAWYFYRRYLCGQDVISLEFTRDLDCAVSRALKKKDRTMKELLKEHGFEWVPTGDFKPPSEKYAWPDNKDSRAVIEFLTPSLGSDRTSTVEVQKGLVAQPLRYLNILIEDTLTLKVDESYEGNSFRGSIVVPKPGMFVAQKALSYTRRRTSREKGKDLHYMYDLIDRPQELENRIVGEIKERNDRAWYESMMANLKIAFSDQGRDEIGWILDQELSQTPSRKYVFETFNRFIEHIEHG